MKLSKLNELPSTREMIDVFGGYNHNIRIGEGEFYDMTNLTSAEYPSLSPRKKRGIYKSPDKPLGLISKDALCYVDGSDLYINEYKIEDFLEEIKDEESGEIIPKTLVSMGAYIIILPNKKYINTQDYSDKGDIEDTVLLNSGNVYFRLCKKDGTFFSQPSALKSYRIKEQATAPTAVDYGLEELPNETYWMDTSNDPVLKVYDSNRSMWSEVSNTYVRLLVNLEGNQHPFKNIKEYDGVIISGIKDEALTKFNGTFHIETVWNDTDIVIKGFINTTEQIKVNLVENPITIKRGMPDMDFVIESENRLWGCKYGLVDGKMVNEIYASKLGDFKNWNCFAGISTDSYVASVGTDGQFTGAITYLGYPLFFKEDCIHKVYGSYPANFQIQTTACRGVQKGSSKSLALVNETLFYKSRYSVCAYDGALPVEISSALGNERYSDAVAGSLGNKYYISMKGSDGDYHLFVYDVFKNMWHKEDNTQVVQFCNNRGNLYYIDYDSNQIRIIEALPNASEGEIEPEPIRWSAETGIIGTDSPDKKYISRLVVRLSLEFGTEVSFFADYDSIGVWKPLFTMDGTTLKTFSIPLRTRRCDHLRLRIEGIGAAQIFSICKTIEQGSDQ